MKLKLQIGPDLTGQLAYAEMRFVDGRAGGHLSISGVFGMTRSAGAPTSRRCPGKISYVLFLL
jgi:hypothetical protein